MGCKASEIWCRLLTDQGQFTSALALYDPFGVDVPLNLDIITDQAEDKGP